SALCDTAHKTTYGTHSTIHGKVVRNTWATRVARTHNEPSHGAERVLVRVVLADHYGHLVSPLVAQAHQCTGVGQVVRRGLLQERVLAGRSCGGRHLEVEVHGQGDNHGVNVGAGQHLAPVAAHENRISFQASGLHIGL